MDDCAVKESSATQQGGGIFLGGDATADISNCTISENTAADGGGLYIGDTVNFESTAIVANSSICNNQPNQVSGNGTFVDDGGNSISDECLPDPDNGACCVAASPEATCISNINEAECTAQGGTFYQGQACEQTTCPAVGACCTGTDTCTVTFAADCDGVFYQQQLCGDISCEKIVVDPNAEDDGSGTYSSIQGAIDASYDGMTISVMAGTYTGTGDSVITLPDHGITIRGIDGAESTIIDGQGVRRGITCEYENYVDNGTVIEGLTFTNGAAGLGGGAYLFNCCHEFSWCTFTSNLSGKGGAIYARHGTPSFTNCTFESNTAQNTTDTYAGGGAVFFENVTASILDSTFIENTANADGGGLYVLNAHVTLERCTLDSNTALSSSTNHWGGGGMRIHNGSATLSECIFEDNASVGPVSHGGGLCAYEADINLHNCNFARNNASNTGGMIWAVGGTAELTNCTASGNSAAHGGGIFVGASCTTTMSSCDITDNTAAYGMGGMYIDGSDTTITNCNFTGNATSEEHQRGGGIYIQGTSDVDIDTTTVCGNTPDQIVGDYTDNGGNTIRTNCDYWVVDDLFDDDPNADFDNIQEAVDAAVDGEEILVMPGTYVENVDISRSVNLHGLDGERSNTIIDAPAESGCVNITGSTAQAITVVIGNMTIQNADIAGWGGGIAIAEAHTTVQDCIIQDNTAARGAGIATDASAEGANGSLNVINCLIQNNTSDREPWRGSRRLHLNPHLG